MKYNIPLWKKWVSYIIELELERLDSEHGHELSICISDGRLQLNAENAIYSWEDKYDNFYKAFQHIFKDQKYQDNSHCIDNVLILGLGLASIPQMLEQKFHKNYQFAGVEIDEQVIYLAEKYILHQLLSRIETIQAPAEIFVHSTTQKYDMICIDIFINDTIPAAIKDHQFLEASKELLTAGGTLLFNHLANHQNERKSAKLFFEKTFLRVFPDGELLDVDGNFIFIGIN